MKKVTLYATMLVASVIVIAAGDDTPITPIPTECPKKDSVNFTVHIAHESNCSLFYMCERGYKILRICPLRDQAGNRLYFNPLLQVCDWPENAGCISEDGTTSEPLTTEPTEPTKTTEIPITTTEVPTIPTEIPITNTEVPITTTEIPITTTEMPIPTTEVPTISTEIPTKTTEIPITTTEIPLTSTEVPTISTEMPTKTTETPIPSTEIPITTTEISTTTEDTPNIPDLSEEDSDYIIVRNARSISRPRVTECPLDSLLGTTSIKVPHESDCRLYYTCENGTKFLNECEEGLYYNPLLQMCDWENESSCNRTSPTPIPTPKPSPPSDPTPITQIPTECPTKDSVNFTIHVAHESNCSLFYMCERGHKILRICPLRDQEGNRLYFNPLLQVCDWPENAGCTSEDGTTPEPPTTEPTEPTKTTEVPTISTEIPITTTEVSTISTEIPTITTEIPITTTEMPITSTEVPTISTEIPTTTSEIPITTEEIPTTNTEITITSTEVSITTTEIQTTTENTTNISDLFQKDSDYIIVRNPRSVPRQPVAEYPLDLLLENTEIKIPHESNCSLYYKCKNGTKVLNVCDEGLYYNSLLQMCDWKTEDSCSGISPAPTSIPTPKPSPPTNPTTCPEVDPEYPVLLPHECACDKYYQCMKGEQILKMCPKGKGFNAKLGKCLSLNHSDCFSNDSEIPEDEDPYPAKPPALKLKVCDYPAIAGCRYTHRNENRSTKDENSFYARLFHWGS